MPETDPMADLIMVATGTGIAVCARNAALSPRSLARPHHSSLLFVGPQEACCACVAALSRILAPSVRREQPGWSGIQRARLALFGRVD